MFQILESQHVYDVAIIGSGAAGGMTAHVLTEGGLAMLEAGPLRKPGEFPIHRIRRWNLPYRGLRGDYMQEWLEATHFLADQSKEPYGWVGSEPFEWVRVRAVGRLDLLPPSTREVISTTEDLTRVHQGMVLTIAVAYSGQEEISDAVKAFLRNRLASGESLAGVIGQVTPAAISEHLYSVELPDPDLIIRTSGEIRLSGFLLWQSAHSEFYFSDVYWPAFRKIDFLRAVRAYQQ